MNNNDKFDAEAIRHNVSDMSALIANLRPTPDARLLSRLQFKMMAAIAGDEDMMHFATRMDENTLVWDVGGEIVEQRVSLRELPVG